MGRRLAVLLLLVLAACGDDAPQGSAPAGRLKVVTTVSPITNIVANVAGGLVALEGIVPEGENSHEFEPAPSVARTLAGADVVVINGLNLETRTRKLAEANLKPGAEIVELGRLTITEADYIFDFSFPREEGDPNPHLWTNPPYVKAYAGHVRDLLSRRDPANTATYAKNYEALAAQVDAFDRALRTATETVPKDQRKLLTYHDSFPYFAREYGWTVVGAIQPSDFTEPSPKDVAALIEQIKREKVKAIFGSEVFPSPVLEQIARETGAVYVDNLRDDDLPGDPGDPKHSLPSLLQFDYSTIVKALGGDSRAIDSVDVTNPVSDVATYA